MNTVIMSNTVQKYKVGELFWLKDSGVYMFSRVEDFKYCLICLETGNRWSDPKDYDSIMEKIKKYEFTHLGRDLTITVSTK